MAAIIGMPYLLFLPSELHACQHNSSVSDEANELVSNSEFPIVCHANSTWPTCESDEVVTTVIKADDDVKDECRVVHSDSSSTRFDSDNSYLCSSEEDEFDLDCFTPCEYIEAADEDEVTDEMRVALFLAGLQKRQRLLSRIAELPDEDELSSLCSSRDLSAAASIASIRRTFHSLLKDCGCSSSDAHCLHPAHDQLLKDNSWQC